MDKYDQILEEAFGEPLKIAISEPVKLEPVRVKISLDDEVLGDDSSEEDDVCPVCGMMMVDGECGCADEGLETCPGCGMPVDQCACEEYEDESVMCGCGMMKPAVDQPCSCGMSEAKQGPSAKTAKKILRGTKTFKEKMKKVSGWADDPAAAAAWMMHKATGKWPSEKE